MCTCIDILKLKVSCSHLNYLGGLGIQVLELNFFFFIFHQVRLGPYGLGLAVRVGEGGLGTEILPGPPKPLWWAQSFLILKHCVGLQF
jgi:hypothetical protein